jgi:hypothetical protein
VIVVVGFYQLSISARCASTNKLEIRKTAINTKIELKLIAITSKPEDYQFRIKP